MFDLLVAELGAPATAELTHGELEELCERRGGEVVRQLLQDHLDQLGETLHAMGRSTDALAQLMRARAIRQQVGDRSGEGESCSTIPTVLQTLDRRAEAKAFLCVSMKIYKELGEPRLDDVRRRLLSDDIDEVQGG
ncbi:hypothetical protein [Nonomuraea lactucae]|uniref:hypothetical protein n=1 Tax=Nonomuraea lactucae TaxID=2249762 RepID=UPI000DE51B04|nr:hypothetical protein [Nonomuraea lactucae]